MNKVILMGRLTRDPEVRYAQNESGIAVARYNLAVDRKYKRDGEQDVDFINCVAFGRAAEFAEKYFYKGIKLVLIGRIQTGSYVNKDGQRVYTTDVVIEEQEFAESKSSGSHNNSPSSGTSANQNSNDGFMNVTDDEELPFVGEYKIVNVYKCKILCRNRIIGDAMLIL